MQSFRGGGGSLLPPLPPSQSNNLFLKGISIAPFSPLPASLLPGQWVLVNTSLQRLISTVSHCYRVSIYHRAILCDTKYGALVALHSPALTDSE